MIYISGSMAYDRIMNFPGSFADCILPDKIHMLSTVFLIDSLKQEKGGTGGNIAYNLALLNEKPLVLSSAGTDFDGYAAYLEGLGLSLRGIRRVENEFTAGAYIITDQSSNQITAFHPAAMNYSCNYSFEGLNPAEDWGIVSPSNMDDMYAHSQLYRQKGVRYIFDPGQQIPAIDPNKLAKAIEGSFALAGNDYEMSLISERTGLSKDDLLKKTGAIITTMGQHGSRISFADGREAEIPAVRGIQAADPTGAGDSYRAGMLKGLTIGLGLAEAACLGSICASFCVEKHGTQEHSFGKAAFAARYKETFDAPLPEGFSCAMP